MQSNGNLLDLGNGFAVDKKSKYRLQHVVLDIEVPVGKKITLDRTLFRKLNLNDFRVKRSYRRGRVVGIEWDEDRSFQLQPDVEYTMQADRTLKDTNGKQAEIKDGYRYSNDSGSREQLDETTEETGRTAVRKEDVITEIGSPTVFSLLKSF